MTEHVINALWSQGVLFELTVNKSQFQKKNRPQDTGLDEDLDPGVMTPGSKKLLPPHAIKRLSNIEANARAILRNRSMEFPLSGARFVYYRTLGTLTAALEEIKKEWDAAVLDITANYEALKKEQIAALDAQALKIAGSTLKNASESDRQAWLEEQYLYNKSIFPPLDEVKDRFGFGWRMYKVNAVDGLSTMGAVEQEAVLEAQKKLQQEMKAWVKEASAALHKKLGEAAAHTAEMLKKQGKLNPKNLKPLFDAFEEFKAVDFTGSSDFRDKIDKITKGFLVTKDGQADMATTAASVNNTEAGMAAFKQVLGEISALAVDAVAEEAGMKSLTKVGEFKRMVEID